MSTRWYALNVKPHKERAVYERLLSPDGIPALVTPDGERRPYDVFFPSVRVKPKNPRAAKVRPYFPGYLFVYADLEELGAAAFTWVPGTRGLVTFGEEPAVVPEQLIRELRERVAAIEAAGGLVFDELKPGDRVRIVSGPFAGYEAIFDMRLPGAERVQVLLAFLSQHPHRLKLDVTDIEKAKKS